MPGTTALLLLLAPSAAALVATPLHHRVRLAAASPCGAARSPAPVLELVRGVGEGRDLPSPSGINTYPLPLQAATVLGIAAAIAAFAALIAGPGFDAVRGSGLWNLSRPTWVSPDLWLEPLDRQIIT